MSLLWIYPLAALAEIAGCFSFWAWWKLARSPLWLIPGLMSLALFAWLLSLVDVSQAGRAFAIYGGAYIAVSVIWLWLVEHQLPSRWDILGSAICLLGSVIIVLGARGQ
ncbi:YnfA family protein [Cobetia sp. L2A1]|uniref:YnfA family protein n=1 Tax=Cobetia sp. L2A1 TaxID=2686360 RepID=UPI00131C2115|nr:YnfA family protein [Cobetia sp. L2A1]